MVRLPSPPCENSQTPHQKALDLQMRMLRKIDRQPKTEGVKRLNFPGWPYDVRAIPNHFARTSIFSPIARQGRKQVYQERLISRSDALIYFSGVYLDEADCDVWLQLIHQARLFPDNEFVSLERSKFLRKIGRKKSGDMYKWLLGSIERLNFATIGIGTGKYSFHQDADNGALHLVAGFDYDSEKGTYRVYLDPRMPLLFQNSEYALIDWDLRLRMAKNKNMSKFLQRLVATSSDIQQAYSIEFLRGITRYSSQESKFHKTLAMSLNELQALGVIASWEISEGRNERMYARWQRLPKGGEIRG